MTLQPSQPARKILVIGGSSYNENTLEKIGQALIDSNFLDEWAVIIAIHQLLKLKGDELLQEEDDTRIKSRLSLSKTLDLKIKCITSPQIVKVETGYTYVLPYPVLPIDKKYLYTSFMGSSIYAKTSIAAKKEYEKWLLNNPFDASGIKRQMTCGDVISVDWKKLPLSLIQDESNFRNFRENMSIDLKSGKSKKPDVIYRDIPCIDKFMSEVAASKSQPTIAALLLCGLYGDGAKGLKEIKNKGGHTAVQFPDECCKKELKDKANATASMPATALQIENTHEVITLEDKPGITKLSEWLSKIK